MKNGKKVKNKSYWLASTKRREHFTFKRDLDFDVVVVGAGIAGINCAYLLVQEGYKVAVIDSGRVSHGVTGYTTAKITSQHNLIYKFLLENFGKEKAKKYVFANERSIEMYSEIIEKEKISCDFSRQDAYVYASKTKDKEEILKEIESTKKLGVEADFIEDIKLPVKNYGAIRFRNQAQFHPVKYIQKLVECIEAKEGYIFENTRVVDVKDNKPCLVKTDKGNVRAKHVFLATHFPFLDQKSKYYAKMRQKRSYILAIKSSEKFPKGMYISYGDDFKSFRTQPEKNGEMILIGGEKHSPGDGRSSLRRQEKLIDYAKSNFKVKSFEYIWSTQDNITLDRIPYIGKLDKNSKSVYVATGFGGWGMTSGMVAAVLITDLIRGKKNSLSDLFDPHRTVSLKLKKQLFSQGVNVASQFIKGKIYGKSLDNLNIKKGTGCIVNFKGKKLAVYRDTKGKLFANEAKCTHMGCTLSWNDAEKSWDCPCHASRFNYDGKRIHGPAIVDLKPFDNK